MKNSSSDLERGWNWSSDGFEERSEVHDEPPVFPCRPHPAISPAGYENLLGNCFTSAVVKVSAMT
jgi:hypothetical protein